jgi:hypothetical protein
MSCSLFLNCSISSFPVSQEEEDDNYQEEQDAGDEFDSDFRSEPVRSMFLPPSNLFYSK